jgi:hypothetical protein
VIKKEVCHTSGEYSITKLHKKYVIEKLIGELSFPVTWPYDSFESAYDALQVRLTKKGKK